MTSPVWDEKIDNAYRTDPGGDPKDPAQLPARVLLNWAATHAALHRKETHDAFAALLKQLPAIVQEAVKDMSVTVEIHQGTGVVKKP